MSKKETKDINNKKQNLSFMLLVILLISVILCISSFGIATWARYRSVTGGNVEAQIARWSFKVNGEEEHFAAIDLADTINFTNVTLDKIAPGTYGSFDLDIDGRESEVSLDYYINILVQNKPINLKFYSDSLYQSLIDVTLDNKIYLEGDLLLSENPMQEIRTVYWKWDYRTESLPSISVLQEYYSNIEGLEALVNEYDTATSQQKQELALKINDKIDTYEQGGNVLLEVSVKGIQINPNFSLKMAQITSQKSEKYEVGDTVNFSLEFTENIYADNNQTAITNATAPEVIVGFGTTTASSPVAKVASLLNTNLNLAIGENLATFVSANENKINYTYTIKSTDAGALRIANITGSVYNGSGKEINFATVQSLPNVIGGTIITDIEPVVAPQIKIGTETVNLTTENVVDYYGKIVTNYNSPTSATWRLFYVDFDGDFGEKETIYLKADKVTNRGISTSPIIDADKALNKMKQLNKEWAQNDGIVDKNNESAVLWLCDEDSWNAYKDTEKAECVIGGTSVEMYMASYNQYHSNKQTTGYQQLKYRWYGSSVSGYKYAIGASSQNFDAGTSNNTIKVDTNNLYIKSGEWWWFATPSSYGKDYVCNVDGGNYRLGANTYDGPNGICPLVALKDGVILEFAN